MKLFKLWRNLSTWAGSNLSVALNISRPEDCQAIFAGLFESKSDGYRRSPAAPATRRTAIGGRRSCLGRPCHTGLNLKNKTPCPAAPEQGVGCRRLKGICFVPIQKWLCCPNALSGGNFNPRHMNPKPAVQITARLEREQNISLLEGHYFRLSRALKIWSRIWSTLPTPSMRRCLGAPGSPLADHFL